MIFRLAILLICVAPLGVNGQSGPAPAVPAPPVLTVRTGQAWLGLQLAKADPSMSAQIPALPPGVGFVIKGVDVGGPAEVALLHPLDVLWKLGDQMLVNEAQLATLLRLSKPGDEVGLSIFRGGQPLEIRMKLGDLPIGRDGLTDGLADLAILPGEGGPMRVVNVDDRTASYSTSEGKAVMRKEGESYLVTIKGPDDQLIFEGDVTGKEAIEQLPRGWQRRVYALRRGLDHAMEGRIVPVRPPRPRVVTPAPAPPPLQHSLR
jgi:hypothetical protein